MKPKSCPRCAGALPEFNRGMHLPTTYVVIHVCADLMPVACNDEYFQENEHDPID